MWIVSIGDFGQNLNMGRFICVFLLTLATTQAQAYELSDNPAFCAGFLAAQSDRDASMMRTHERAIMEAFNRIGPKDSTDGRGYNEWLHVGIAAARDKTDGSHTATERRCRTLIEQIAQ